MKNFILNVLAVSIVVLSILAVGYVGYLFIDAIGNL